MLEPPYQKRIVLDFSAELAEGSKAVLIQTSESRDPESGAVISGGLIASATVDGPGKTMTLPQIVFNSAATYRIEWTSIATDGDLLRGTIEFTVGAAASPSPTPEPTPSPSASASASTPEPASAAPLPSASPQPTDNAAAASTGDVVLPIVVALIVVGAGAVYFLTRRNRPTTSG